MHPKDIKVGKTYANRGAGRTLRTVLAIGTDFAPDQWLGNKKNGPPDQTAVQFQQGNRISVLYLSSFASWAGSEYIIT